MTAPKYVVDTYGTKYQLGTQLGAGGQGAVFAVEGGRFAVKLLNREAATEARRVQAQFAFLKQLDLGNTPIVKPISVLRPPAVGYVMPLLKDMMPINGLMRPPVGCGSILKWYGDTGGIKRRLECLSVAAEAIAELHARGLCYGDVSSANIFISLAIDEFKVSLIDADNLRYNSAIPAHGFFTPGFGAPEIVNRTGTVSTLSDAHSFAVLVFHTLVQNHPLLGDAVHDGEPEMEERALAGGVPWIDHPSDATNRSSRGIPRQYALSERLQALADRAFTEGLLQADSRPTVTQWAEALSRAANQCLRCSGCTGWFYRTESECPWCGRAAAAFLYARFFTESGQERELHVGADKKPRLEGSLAISPGTATTVHAGLAQGLAAVERRAPIMKISFAEYSIKLERIEVNAHIEIEQGKKHGLLGETITIPESKSKDLRLYFGPRGSNRRVVYFSIEGGDRA
jgi:DNA-binding helix-hairpin-helix protein with protein kinase domain